MGIQVLAIALLYMVPAIGLWLPQSCTAADADVRPVKPSATSGPRHRP